jgi:hypothetical protein
MSKTSLGWLKGVILLKELLINDSNNLLMHERSEMGTLELIKGKRLINRGMGVIVQGNTKRQDYM